MPKINLTAHGVEFELRPKGSWRIIHFYLPVFLFFWKIFSPSRAEEWMDTYWSVQFVPFSKKKVIYGPRIGWQRPSSTMLEHESVHAHRVSWIKYALFPSYRLAEELEGYKVNMYDVAVAQNLDYVSYEHEREIANKLIRMYFLKPFLTEARVRSETHEAAKAVSRRLKENQ